MAKKKFDYFLYFKQISEIICEAAEFLHRVLRDFDSNALQKSIDYMHEIEHRADCAKHEMTQLLAHEFITPIEREDIVALAQELDNVVDKLEDVLLRIYMFGVKAIRKEAVAFSGVIVKCSGDLDKVLAEFKNFKNSATIRDGIVAVNHYESDGDALLVENIRMLSASAVPDREFYMWTDIYEHLEECLDACEDVADIIESVIMKNT